MLHFAYLNLLHILYDRFLYARGQRGISDLGHLASPIELPRPVIVITIHHYGMEHLAAWCLGQGGKVIRDKLSREQDTFPGGRTPVLQRWDLLTGQVRQTLYDGGMIPPGVKLRQSVDCLHAGRLVVLCQDVAETDGRGHRCQFLGEERTWRVGAARLSQMTGAPIYFGITEYRRGWHLAIRGPIVADESAVRTAVQQAIEKAPWRWSWWQSP